MIANLQFNPLIPRERARYWPVYSKLARQQVGPGFLGPGSPLLFMVLRACGQREGRQVAPLWCPPRITGPTSLSSW